MTETGVIPGTGTYFVGIDMPPGRYRCENGKNGWWVLFSGEGGSRPVGAWPLDPGPAEVDIAEGDFAFETHVPSMWTLVAPATPERAALRPVTDPTLRADLDTVVARRGPLLRSFPFAALAGAVLAFFLLDGDLRWLVMGAAILAAASRRLLDDMRRARALTARTDRFLTVDAFDTEASELLGRVQHSLDTVRSAKVVADGLLEGIDPAVELPRQEWEIAQILARQSKLRRDAAALTLSPQITEALKPQQDKLAISVAAVTRRVEALEKYAARTREADIAYRACRQLEDLASHAHEYDELLADSVRDDLAVPAIERLTEQSDELLRTLQDRLDDATEAAELLPPGRPVE
ncbi:hypothetical protein [Actinocorallia longicatena]|uniref:Uncharacterized protein n=1 Tax=Actinocorallia longicatena TaxID=111803 RepID=A0ABP6PYW2_9ACTN